MKKIMILVFVVFCFSFSTFVNAAPPLEPTGPKPKEAGPEKPRPSPVEPAAPKSKEARPEKLAPSPVDPATNKPLGEIFFAAGTSSSDGKYLYVVFDRFLLKYVLPSLDLEQKADLGIAAAPVTPSISVSKDSKTIYIISNGMLYKVDTTTFKVKKQVKIAL